MNALVRKLQSFAPISEDDLAWLTSLCERPVKTKGNVDIVREGDDPEYVQVVLKGLACRYKSAPDSSRQIFAYLVPGDFCDLHVALFDEMDHSIATLSPCSVVKIPKRDVFDLIDNRPALARAFWWCSLVDAAVLREWIVNIATRQAEQRITHLFCELHVRFKVVDLTTDGSFVLPITQVHLGDTTGLSTVHVNRSLKELRKAGLVTFRGELVQVPDVRRLKAYADFNPNYLHLQRKKPA